MRRDRIVRATSYDVIDEATAFAERPELPRNDPLYLAAVAVVGLGRLCVALDAIATSLSYSEPRGRN